MRYLLNLLNLLILVVSQLLLSSCAQQIAFGNCDTRLRTAECMRPFNYAKNIDLLAINRAAADDLLNNAQDNLDTQHRILVTTVADLNNLASSAPLGRLVAEQLAARITEKGFKVVEVRLQDGVSLLPGGEFILSRDTQQLPVNRPHTVSRIITGTYSMAEETVFIQLKLLDFLDKKAIAAHSYTLPITKDIHSLLLDNKFWWQ